MSCHRPGGLGPFTLDDYDSARAWGPLCAEVIAEGEMPPWPPSTCCAPLRHTRRLADDELAILERWLEVDAP